MGSGLMITLTISFILIMVAGVIDITSEKIQTETKCYDKYGHKINDLVCEEKGFANKQHEIWYNSFLIAGILNVFLMPLILITIDNIMKRRE